MLVTYNTKKEMRISIYSRISFFIIFAVLLITIADLPRAWASDHLELLLDQARLKELHKKQYWHILLQYKKGFFCTKSLIDDPNFFLSPKGKTDPRAELEATIKTFFTKSLKNEDVPICRYIARYTWLKQQLDIDPSEVTLLECEKVDQVKPRTATLIFPTYYMNNPASMFGHTLLNIETEYADKLLTKSVNYAAVTQDTNGILFAFKGLFGFYKGYYSVQPYYKKIQQYSDISQRDIWEYRLNLMIPELENMVRQIRSLETIYADYFFFDENCSYNLLFLLESARPGANLTDKFSMWAIPIDTIKAVEKSGIIDSAVFRPSKASRIRHKISLLDEKSQNIALEITQGKITAESLADVDISNEKKIIILDLAADVIGYKYAKKKMKKTGYQETLLSVLKQRSKLGKRDVPYRPAPPPRPDKAHDSRRLDVGLGTDMDESFFEISFRPAFCDLLDTHYPYHQGSQIKFLDTRFRYYTSNDKLVLDSLDLIDIISISPRDKFFKPLSWKVQAGVYREIMSDGYDAPVFRLGTGGGLAYHSKWLGLSYMFCEPEFQYGTDLEKNFALGGGISLGVVNNITKWWKYHLYARQIYFELGDGHRSGEVTMSQNFIVTKNNHIRLDAVREKAFGNYNTEVKINWCWFF